LDDSATADLRDRFLQGMSCAAATVNVVTTDGPAGRSGVTVSAMSSVSADGNAPTLLVCVHEKSPTARTIIENGCFCVNVFATISRSCPTCLQAAQRPPARTVSR
jgi:flavin reductase